jgi:hypothetical protein
MGSSRTLIRSRNQSHPEGVAFFVYTEFKARPAAVTPGLKPNPIYPIDAALCPFTRKRTRANGAPTGRSSTVQDTAILELIEKSEL